MRGRQFVCAFVVASIVGCRGGHVSDVSHDPRDLGDYESAVVRVSGGRDAAAKNDELVEFEGEIVQRLRDGTVFARVSREDTTAQLSVNVLVEKLEDTQNPLDINGRMHAEARATVEVVDRGTQRLVGQFSVEASDTDRPTIIVPEKGTARSLALRNVARAVARKLRASR